MNYNNKPRLIVFDLKGREVKTQPVTTFEDQQKACEIWDGCNKNGQPVESGKYICYVENRGQILDSGEVHI